MSNVITLRRFMVFEALSALTMLYLLDTGAHWPLWLAVIGAAGIAFVATVLGLALALLVWRMRLGRVDPRVLDRLMATREDAPHW